MKKSWIKRSGTTNDRKKAIHKLDAAVSILIRGESGNCVTCGERKDVYDCGHFQWREKMSTRFDYRNLGKQCLKCNRFQGGKPYEFSLWIDKTWGAGTAKKLYKISQHLIQWTIPELEQLTSAARHSMLAYRQLYDVIIAEKLGA